MSFGGHVLDMINRTKFNEEQKKARRRSYKKLVEYDEQNLLHHRELHFKGDDISKAELEKIKKTIRENAKKDFKRSAIWLLAISVFIVILFVVFIYSSWN